MRDLCILFIMLLLLVTALELKELNKNVEKILVIEEKIEKTYEIPMDEINRQLDEWTDAFENEESIK